MSKESKWKGTSKANCQALVDHALNRDPTVKFMYEKLAEVKFLTEKHA